jgi:site-specific DNA-methyltransferase (adenine-specific)
MFSFVGDTVLDPFMGTATTLVAATSCDRNAIGVEIEPSYVEYAQRRLERKASSLFTASPQIILADVAAHKVRKCG